MGEDKSKLYGFYRAKVVDNKDPKKFGRVMVWIPDIMPKVEDTKGLWALPGNNPISGLNSDGDSEHQFAGSVYIPPKGSYIWIFFENGNPNRPFYFSGLDLQNTMVLPECQSGTEYQKKWVIFKSHEGRCIVISDDPEDSRLEITGKKRQINTPPVGDIASVFQIDGNQTTILLDEREGKEKILLRSHKGDYINFDVENQKLQISFSGDIQIKSNGSINIKAADVINLKAGTGINIHSGADVNLKAGGNINSESSGDVNLKAGSNVNNQAGTDVNLNAGANVNSQAGGIINELASGPVNLDGSGVNEMSGAAGPAGPAGPASDAIGATPNGDR